MDASSGVVTPEFEAAVRKGLEDRSSRPHSSKRRFFKPYTQFFHYQLKRTCMSEAARRVFSDPVRARRSGRRKFPLRRRRYAPLGLNPTMTLVANSRRRSIGRNLGRMGSLEMGKTRAFVARDAFATSVNNRDTSRKVAALISQNSQKAK